MRVQVWVFGAVAFSLLASAVGVQAQSPAAMSAPAPVATPAAAPELELPGGTGILPLVLGWNAGLTLSGVHDSLTGWSTLANPVVGYAFNRVFSVEATIPIYMYRLAESIAPRPKPNAMLVTQRAELGDIVLSFDAQLVPKRFVYLGTAAVTAPSGDETYGLTTGRVTFDLNNHFERSFGRMTPTLELGGGDSSTLVNRVVTKTYTSLGPLAHFQAGLAADLARGVSFEADAYEQLPIGDQKIYGPTRRGHPADVVGHHIAEDNGFITLLDIPLDAHTTVSGYYDRSLRLHTDTVGFSVTYMLRGLKSDEQSANDLFR